MPRAFDALGADFEPCEQRVRIRLQKGLSTPDFEEYRRRRPKLTIQTAANTWNVPGELASVGDPATTPVRVVSVTTLRDALARYEGEHVLFLSEPIAVADSSPVTAGWFSSTCVPRCDYDSLAPGLAADLRRFESIEACHPFAGHLLPAPPAAPA